MQPRHVAAGVGAGLALWLLWRRLRRRQQDAKAGASALHATVVLASAGGRAQPHAVLHTGRLMPLVGLGTWKAKPGDVERAVRAAIEAGYRHIDTAAAYQNEREVGQALAKSGLRREDVYITTKLWNADQGYDSTLAAFDKSMERLGLEDLDVDLVVDLDVDLDLNLDLELQPFCVSRLTQESFLSHSVRAGSVGRAC